MPKSKLYLLLAVLIAFVVIGGYVAWNFGVFIYWTGIPIKSESEIFVTGEADVHKLVYKRNNYLLTSIQACEGSGAFEIMTQLSLPNSAERCKAGPLFKNVLASFTRIKAIRSISLSSIRDSDYPICLGTLEIYNFGTIEPVGWAFRANANKQILAIDNVQGYIVDIRPVVFELLKGGCSSLALK
jgi:hypothetical protein